MKSTFGIDATELTRKEIRAEITVHKNTIARGQVGTPNVYVRLGDLQRELVRRRPLPAPRKLWGFTIEVYDGEHEYYHYESILAASEEEADRKAREYTESFYGDKMKVAGKLDDGTPFQWTGDGAEYRIVKMKGTPETSIREILKQNVINAKPPELDALILQEARRIEEERNAHKSISFEKDDGEN